MFSVSQKGIIIYFFYDEKDQWPSINPLRTVNGCSRSLRDATGPVDLYSRIVHVYMYTCTMHKYCIIVHVYVYMYT